MATSPALLQTSSIELPVVSKAWIRVFFSLTFICFTSSTLMSGYHTQFIVNSVWKAIFGNWHFDMTGIVNGDGRKIGHFFGYGAIGLVFRHAWHQTLSARAMRLGRAIMHSRLLILSAAMSVLSILIVASADELHQCFLPQRVGSFGDVLRDTFGTIFLNLVLLAYRAYKRPEGAYAWSSAAYSSK